MLKTKLFLLKDLTEGWKRRHVQLLLGPTATKDQLTSFVAGSCGEEAQIPGSWHQGRKLEGLSLVSHYLIPLCDDQGVEVLFLYGTHWFQNRREEGHGLFPLTVLFPVSLWVEAQLSTWEVTDTIMVGTGMQIISSGQEIKEHLPTQPSQLCLGTELGVVPSSAGGNEMSLIPPHLASLRGGSRAFPLLWSRGRHMKAGGRPVPGSSL